MEPLNALDFDAVQLKLGDNFLLLGTDAWLQDSVTGRVREELRRQAEADLVIIYGDEAKAAQINDLLDTYSIFSSAKLILLRNADALNKAELDCLAAYFANPSDQQSLVILADKIDARLSGWKKIKEACRTVVCDPPNYSGKITPWLDKALLKLGKSMTMTAKSAFSNRVELDYANANNELQKLCLLAGDKQQITEADVLRSIGSSRVGTQIDFYRALGKRQLKDALTLLERMLSSEFKPLQVSYLINRFYTVIYGILLLKHNHISASEITSKHLNEVYPSQRQEYLGFAANYQLRQMEAIFQVLLDTDASIKLSLGSDEVLLTACLLRVMEAA